MRMRTAQHLRIQHARQLDIAGVLRAAADALAGIDAPLLIAGGGVLASGAWDGVRALAEALAARALGGAALDVLEVEPPATAAPAPEASRLVVNRHAGWYSEDAEEEAPRRATEAVRDVLEGRVPANPVNEVASSVP